MSSLELPPLLTVAQAADHLRVHEKTVRRMISEGRLRASHLHGCGGGIRGRLRIRLADLEALLTDSEVSS